MRLTQRGKVILMVIFGFLVGIIVLMSNLFSNSESNYNGSELKEMVDEMNEYNREAYSLFAAKKTKDGLVALKNNQLTSHKVIESDKYKLVLNGELKDGRYYSVLSITGVPSGKVCSDLVKENKDQLTAIFEPYIDGTKLVFEDYYNATIDYYCGDEQSESKRYIKFVKAQVLK